MQQQFHYEIIFMDCQMPAMDGYEVTKTLRENERGSNKHQVIIAMIANAIVSDRENCFSKGMDDYLSKPVSVAKLRLILNKWSNLSLLNKTG